MMQPILETAGKAAMASSSSFAVFRAVSAFASPSAAAPATAAGLLQTAATTAAAVAVSSLRGGAGGEALLDINRVKIRLEGLSSYGVMTALLMNAGMRLYSSTPKNVEFGKSNRADNIAKLIFCASMVLSILTGAHTTIVFSMLGLYSKTALGKVLEQLCILVLR